ncbi:MAG: hypothetical protein Kow0031_23630 [Anaerolineae bacterium]
MSPKKLTRIAIFIGLGSLITLPVMALAWGTWSWWPVMGLALAFLMLVVSFMWGAYLSAQKRVEMVDKLNDCYTGNTQPADAEKSVVR